MVVWLFESLYKGRLTPTVELHLWQMYSQPRGSIIAQRLWTVDHSASAAGDDVGMLMFDERHIAEHFEQNHDKELEGAPRSHLQRLDTFEDMVACDQWFKWT